MKIWGGPFEPKSVQFSADQPRPERQHEIQHRPIETGQIAAQGAPLPRIWSLLAGPPPWPSLSIACNTGAFKVGLLEPVHSENQVSLLFRRLSVESSRLCLLDGVSDMKVIR